MGAFRSIAAVGESLERFLSHCFHVDPPIAGKSTKAVRVRTEDWPGGDGANAVTFPALSVFLYRVDSNKTVRAAWSAVGSHDGRSHLALDLHFLLTPWADNAHDEYLIVGRTLQCLEDTPILAGPLLHPSGEWTAQESLQLCLEDLSTEELMRTFDTLPGDYKLSVPYLARVVRIDGRVLAPAPTSTKVISGVRASTVP